MNSITKKLKQHIVSLDSVEERLNHLKDKYKNKTAVILAPGPTLKTYDLNTLSNRDDIVILAIKQAYDIIKGQADFHIMNTYNFDKYKGYEYEHLNSIIFYGLSKSYVRDQMQKLAIKPHPCDIWVPVVNPPYITYEQCMHKSADFDKLFMLSNEPQTWWGTSILYEQAIPMALLIGCKKITTIGWDLGTGHFYKDKDVNFKPTAEVKETNESILTTKELYNWCVRNKIEINIASKTNPADSRFNRINNLNEI